MRIAVWCASEPGADPKYIEAASKLGRLIAQSGNELVYGGSQGGLMGAVADSCLEAGGQVTGVSVNVPTIAARMHPGLTSRELAPTFGERKNRMIELADAVIALPGGPGTLDEIGDVLTLLRLGAQKPMALISIDGFYGPLRAMLANMVAAKFVDESAFALVDFAPDVEAALAFVGA